MVKALGWTELGSAIKKKNRQIKVKRFIKSKIVICH